MCSRIRFSLITASIIILNCLVRTSKGSLIPNELRNVTNIPVMTPAQWTEPFEDGLWSTLLEEWTLKNKNVPLRGRKARIIQTVEAPQFNSNFDSQNQPYQKYIPTSESYLISRRTGDSNNIINKHQQNPTPLRLQVQRQNQFNSPREVSETDLYLLGAIEKLVHRVDYMEKRLKRTEQLVYYLMAGNSQKPEKEPCPDGFSKIGENCFHFGVRERVDWKTAAGKCKSFGSSLAELSSKNIYQDVISYVLNNQTLRGHDYWIGGLNPGLLWIWSASGKPVNPNANISSLTNKPKPINKVSVENSKQNENSLAIELPEIEGDGRCLRLSYNPSLFNYAYSGHTCDAKQSFICIILDKTLDNEIKRISKDLDESEPINET